jgi:hypothetical protein
MTQPNQNQPPAPSQGQNQGQNQQNSGRNQGNRQQQPPKTKCSHCGADNQIGKFCTACSKPMEVTCSSCGAAVKNTTYCGNCGAKLNEPPPTQQTIAKSKTEKWELEVTPTKGARGSYAIAIQVSKNGKGDKYQVYVAIGDNSVTGVKCATYDTDDKGFLELQETIRIEEAELSVRVLGCQANTERRILLQGAKQIVPGGFWANFWASINFYKKR